MSCTALLNFVGPDRPELLFPIKELLRSSADPGERDLARLKRVLRYLVGHRRRALHFPWCQGRPDLTVAVDSDFAGCLETRKSSAGGCARWGGAVVKCWCRTLPTIALSSGEAELGALVKGAAEADGLVAILGDFGIQAAIVLESDASAAVGITQRLGLG